ncbi:maestro heat-like repeat-containing protein family member 9 [Saccopteryx bilineata]|uniref:maestro heat-like repeat-containing protein family member 9 n=1 Tax=Saccopteryx bilineata TaxID=59482 RepID=UPI00338FA0D9
MSSRTHKTNSGHGRDKAANINFQLLQSTVKWQQLEYKAASLCDVYAGILSYQAIILSINSSFLDPLLQYETQLQLLKSSFKMVFAIPSLDKVEAMGDEDDKEDLEELYHSIIKIYENTLLILVSKDLYKLQLLKEMIVWMHEDSFYLQKRIMVTINRVLNYASRKATGYINVHVPCLGVLAAELSLLCSHNDPSIQQLASKGMYYLLCIAQCQKELQPIILKKDSTEITQSIVHILLPSLLTDFVWSLLLKLFVPDHIIAEKAATTLIQTLEYHSHKVTKVSKILDAIYKELSGNSTHIMKHSMLRIITLLTCTSPKKVIYQLMDYPADNTLKLMYDAAGSESRVAPHVLETILLILKGKPGENSTDRRRFSFDDTNMMPVAACQVLCTLLPMDSYKKAVSQFFPQLLMALMFHASYSSSMQLVMEKCLYAQDALRVLLNCSGLQQVDTALKRMHFWNQDSQKLFDHHQRICLIAKILMDNKFPQFPETLQYLYVISVQGLKKSEDNVVTVIFLTELLSKFFKDPFPNEFLALFRKWVNDTNPEVSKLSLQKIAGMAPVINKIKNVDSLLLAILDAFLSKERTVVIVAMLTFRRLLNKLDKIIYSTLCTRIISSYFPLMNHTDGDIQSMAIQHFGELLSDMSQYRWMLADIMLKALVPLMLFLEDTEMKVVTACKYTLKICITQLNWPVSHLLLDQYYNFELVVRSLCNNIFISHGKYMTDLISDTLGFLKSSRLYQRRASIILLGYLATLGSHLLHRDDTEVMLEAVKRVLRDSEDPVIRDLAETTCKLLKEVAHKLISSNIKQSFRRLFKCMYIKELKPLYNYNSSNDLVPTEMANRKKDEESLTKESDQDTLRKNEGP